MLVGYDELKAMGVPHKPFGIRRKVRLGTFPKPVVGGRNVHKLGAFKWSKKDVLAWLKARKPSTLG